MINTAAALICLFPLSLATPTFSNGTNARRILSACGTVSSQCGLVSLSSASSRVWWSCTSGQISRNNYANSESMSGVIISPGRPLNLTFTAFQTEGNYDVVTVKRCSSADCSQTTTLMVNSGTSLPRPVVSDTGIMLVEWRSDSSVTYAGWSALWTSPRTDLACPPGSYCADNAGTNSRGACLFIILSPK
jgi:hypothetical protein